MVSMFGFQYQCYFSWIESFVTENEQQIQEVCQDEIIPFVALKEKQKIASC